MWNDSWLPLIKGLSIKHKNNRFTYYLVNYLRQLIPVFFYCKAKEKILSKIGEFNKTYVLSRVDYYNKIEGIKLLAPDAISLSEFQLKEKGKAYFFDTYEYTRYFNPKFVICLLFGDITHIPEFPSLTKSRPVLGNNECSVILNLDKARHFNFINDPGSFSNKKDKLVWRVNVHQEHRARFMAKYFDNPMCDLGNVAKRGNYPGWQRPKMTIGEHLKYKFVLCLEGHDVATNLKWVMSSNSIAVMPEPKYETWFMEGKLKPDFHYICIKDDYSDLEERLNYYIANPEAAEKIIKNAHEYVKQFMNKKQEKLISILVVQKYFKKTGQA